MKRIPDGTQVQVAVVGAGPVGVELAIALQGAGVSYILLDAGQIGHTLTWWPRNTRFFSSPERISLAGVPIHNTDQTHPTGEDYLAYMRSLVQAFDLAVNAYEPVERVEKRAQGGFRLHTRPAAGPQSYTADYVVLATGGMNAPNRLEIPGEDLPHVSHYFDEPHAYFGQRLLVVGGRNSAIEAALRCWRAGAEITLSYRRPDLDRERVKPALLADFDTVAGEGNLPFLSGTLPVEIRPGAVTLARTDPHSWQPLPHGRFELAADFVLLLTGYWMDTTLYEQLGVHLLGAECAPEHDPQTMETNVPGVFVAGVAAGGTQKKFVHFIETSHVHVPRILSRITGRSYTPGSTYTGKPSELK